MVVVFIYRQGSVWGDARLVIGGELVAVLQQHVQVRLREEFGDQAAIKRGLSARDFTVLARDERLAERSHLSVADAEGTTCSGS
jgi:hypothetical protein